MRRRGRWLGLSLLLGSCGFSYACSLLIEFDPDLKPCTEDGECLDGYSCMVNQCVLDNSIIEGETCFRNRMCEDSLLCSIPEFVCRRPCASAFADTDECGSGRACVASRDSEERFVAVCQPSECGAAVPCLADNEGIPRLCIQVTATAGICMYPCAVDCPVSQACEDDCRGAEACHPVGLGGPLACLEPGLAGAQGSPCDVSSDRCKAGLACIPSAADVSSGECQTFCDEPADCGTLSCNLAPSGDHSLCGPPL